MQDKESWFAAMNAAATYTAKDIACNYGNLASRRWSRNGATFHYVQQGAPQHDGRKLWTMRAPRDTSSTGEGRPSLKFGHAKRVINVVVYAGIIHAWVVYENCAGGLCRTSW